MEDIISHTLLRMYSSLTFSANDQFIFSKRENFCQLCVIGELLILHMCNFSNREDLVGNNVVFS